MSTAETIARVFQLLSRAYPDYAAKYLQGEGAVQTMRLYQRMLEDIPDDILEGVVLEHIASSPWWPKVADLRGRCLARVVPALPDPYEAWEMVCRHLRERVPLFYNGQFYRARPLPPLVRQAVDWLGGWNALEDDGDFVSNRARFVEIFGRLVERERETFVKRLSSSGNWPTLETVDKIGSGIREDNIGMGVDNGPRNA